MIAVPRGHRRSVVLLFTVFSLLAVPNAFAAGKPGSGTPINPDPNCTPGWNTSGKTVIALDPGHGGTDSGTGYDFTGDGVRDLHEKDVVLNIAQLARTRLETQGCAVCLTRIDDRTLGNSERGEFANAVRARLFVLVHLNGSTDQTVNYTSTFWGKKRKDEMFSNHMLAALNALTPVGSGDFVGQFANGALLTATMESTLAESTFLTNNNEAPLLKAVDSPRRQEIAGAIATGINSYLNP